MNFSPEWEQCYQEGGQAIAWPWSDVVSYVMRYARPTSADYKVLELGCGSGANIPFFKKMGCQYYSIEGSKYVLEQVRRNHPDLGNQIVHGDFTLDIPFAHDFDLIVDRGSLPLATTTAIKQALRLAHGKLKLGGKYIGIEWFSTVHPDYKRGFPAEDSYTRTGFEAGVFAGLGRIHFADKTHLLELFGEFKLVVLEHKLIHREIPDDGWEIATWNLVANKE